MPSSSSPTQQCRRQLRGRKPLDRSSSSFLGSLKSLVTAPLSWFSTTDEFEEAQDFQGKRRRVATAPTERMVDSDVEPPRQKRMRVGSPPRSFYQVSSSVSGYNDPPASAFQNQFQPSHSLAPRSASVSFPVSTSKSYGSLGQPKRAAAPPRNTSIDPPARSPSTSFGLNRDGSMDVSAFNRITVRDTSLPPVAGRSFVMRTSMTPQPQQQREVSEPPSLTALAHNPTFVRAPPQQRIGVPQALSRQPSITLGTLAESIRNTKSPTRQHSLLFPANTIRSSEPPNSGSTIEKALHDLDIYKTPLVPTRLRSSRPMTAMSTSDMFKSRRRSLILMQDERARSKTRRNKEEDDVTNDTKPYAGRGGMKRLLARRKQEAEELEGQRTGDGIDHIMEQDEEPHNKVVKGETEGKGKYDIPLSPPPTEPSAFEPKPVALSTLTGSSLRVGRSKRNHIARPAVRPSKMKFSAVYDDEDDNMEDDEEEAARKKEKEELEAAAKRAPVFNIPEGFSFAKPSSSIEHDMSVVKEPPLPSLPFSLFKATPSTGSSAAEEKKGEEQLLASQPPWLGSSASLPTTNPASAQEQAPLTSVVPSTSATPKAAADSTIPNFFASSSIFSKPLDIPKPQPMAFTGTPSEVSLPPAFPSKDGQNSSTVAESKSNPLGQSTQTSVPTLITFGAPPTNSGPVATESEADVVKANPSTPQPSFGFSLNTPPGQIPGLSNSSSNTPSILSSEDKVSVNSFGALPDPPKQLNLFGSQPPVVTVTPASEQPPASQPAVNPPSQTSTSFGFGPPKSSITEPPKPSVFTSFTFSQPSASAGTTPKPLFGGEAKSASSFNGFSFAKVNKEVESKSPSSPFTFGAAPSTPPPVADKKPAFTFSQAASTTPSAPPPINFSFSAGSTGSADSVSPFSFGQSATPTRPVTPPRNQDQEVNMDESPVRDVQPESKSFGGPSLNSGGFSFASQTNGTGFGFGGTPTSNPFAKNDKPPGSALFGTGGGAGFGQTNNTNSAFSFTQSGSDNVTSRPSTGGSFSFNVTAAEPPKVSAPFAFGGPGNTSGGGFGQPSGSAPNSPSTFSQSSPFTFGAPLPPVQTSFPFASSQPASPATSTSGLPPAFGTGGSSFGQSQASPAAASPSGTLFTIGSSSASRPVKKLPNRRGGKR